MAEKYRHGIYTPEESTEISVQTRTTFAQVVIGTAPVHLLPDPAAAVNEPILCEDITDCKNKIGYLTDFKKFSVCQSMYASFIQNGVAPLVFINVLDPAKHFEKVNETDYQINDNAIVITDDVIVSTLKITAEETPVKNDKYITEWSDGKLTVIFTEEHTGTVKVAYNRIAPEKVTKDDIIGAYDTETGERTGAELIRKIFPKLGILPAIITAPGWSKDDTVCAVLDAKAREINGCYKAIAISDLDTTTIKTTADAVRVKESHIASPFTIPAFPLVKKNGYVIAFSAWLAAVIMLQAAQTADMTCKSPSNVKINIDDCVLDDGTEEGKSVYYDQQDGNELNAAGIVTVISRNGWYTWGNNTSAYPGTVDPKDRWIMSRLSFNSIENDFINSYFSNVDGALSPKMVEDIVTEENIKLASHSSAGRIIGAKILFNASENPASEIAQGHFIFHTQLASNIPGEDITNKFAFSLDMLESAFFGGE